MINFGGFEGNAQTIRILIKIDPKFEIYGKDSFIYLQGIDPCKRSLLSVIKYNDVIPIKLHNEIVDKGIYYCDYEKITEKITGDYFDISFGKSLECSIMEMADDIAYATSDLEDIFKSGDSSFYDLYYKTTEWEKIYNDVKKELTDHYNEDEKKINKVLGKINDHVTMKDAAKKLIDDIYLEPIKQAIKDDIDDVDENKMNDYIDGYKHFLDREELLNKENFRSSIRSYLISCAIQDINMIIDVNKNPIYWRVSWNENETPLNIYLLKSLTKQYFKKSRKFAIADYRGVEIINTLFDIMMKDKKNSFMTSRFKCIIKKIDEGKCDETRERIICDYISGMTDQYACELYSQLTSENHKKIFYTI